MVNGWVHTYGFQSKVFSFFQELPEEKMLLVWIFYSTDMITSNSESPLYSVHRVSQESKLPQS